VTWLVVIWAALLGLWGVSRPPTSAETLKRVTGELRGPRLGDAGQPFDWAKDTVL
jgi:hypothetical protein